MQNRLEPGGGSVIFTDRRPAGLLRNRTIPYTMVYCLSMMGPIIRTFSAESKRLTGTGGLTEGGKNGTIPWYEH